MKKYTITFTKHMPLINVIDRITLMAENKDGAIQQAENILFPSPYDISVNSIDEYYEINLQTA